MKKILIATGAYFSITILKQAALDLKHFKSYEFGPWWLLMEPRLLKLLDTWRDEHGFPCMVSPAQGSLGRYSGNSYHNITKHGFVKAIDIMPYKMVRGTPKALAPSELEGVFHKALDMGFGGVGVYPFWKPFGGLHLDTRPKENRTAQWGAIVTNGQQEYVAAEYSLNRYKNYYG